MQFKVPQFLDIEDKIFGPFTFRQFAYLAGGAGGCFVLYKLLGLLYGFIPIAGVAALALSLAFYKPNNKPFIFMIESMFKYFTNDKLYVWDRSKDNGRGNNSGANKKSVEMRQGLMEPKLTEGKLRDLAWSLDVMDLNKNSGGGSERLR